MKNSSSPYPDSPPNLTATNIFSLYSSYNGILAALLIANWPCTSLLHIVGMTNVDIFLCNDMFIDLVNSMSLNNEKLIMINANMFIVS